MAYNPFDFFRRNQKTAFAALTVFVMFTFVLSFGQGDFFQWLPGWLGSFKNRGKDVMAKIDGRKIYDADLYKYDDDRQLADEFMKSLLNTVMRDLDENLRENSKSGGKEAKDAIGRFLQLRQTDYLSPQILQMAQQGQLQMNMLQQFQQMTKQQTQGAIGQILTAQTSTSADQDLAKSARELIRLDELAGRLGRSGTGSYFFSITR